ncbi:MAG TPA: DsrE family protein [Eubacteriaceae bacterium]|nr:DsrE family protein [Eubacteriaceae bacterium]
MSNNFENKRDQEKIAIVWTSGDRDVALKMVFMYARNAKKKDWWKRVRLVVWGPSAQLLSKDQELQQELKIMQEYGVETFACITCANMYEVTDQLKDLAIEVIPMGPPLTDMIKEGWNVLSF